MDDIYRELQEKIAELKTESTGLAEFSNGVSMDNFFEDRLSLDADVPRVAYIQGPPEALGAMREGMLNLIACLRGLYAVHQHGHWVVKSDGFYGDHLMFQRLYENVAEEIDSLAEKTAGYLGANVLNASDLVARTQEWVDKWSSIECPFHRGMTAEDDFQKVAKACYETCKNAGVMTLGFDDFIMATASTHETHQYLLQQRHEFRNSKEGKREAAKGKEAKVRHTRRVSSLGDLSQFLKLSKDVLIHKSDKDFWKLKKDADGNHVIEKLYDADVLTS